MVHSLARCSPPCRTARKPLAAIVSTPCILASRGTAINRVGSSRRRSASWRWSFLPSSCSDPHHRRLAGPDAHSHVAFEQRIDLAIAGIREGTADRERQELALAGAGADAGPAD